jgi:predicted SnoaL-like aldol condensation-catalyzing enzyme
MNIKNLLASVAIAAIMPMAAVADDATKAFAIEALDATLAQGNPDAVDQYFDAGYIQHNPDIASGADALKGLIENLAQSGNFKADFARVIADGDIVAFHGRYEGFGPTPMIAFDVFRVENGKIVEHWDNLIEQAAVNPSGHSQIDGATEIVDLDKTEENKAKVREFLTRAMIDGEELDYTQYINAENYVQHNSEVGDGLMAFGGFLHEMEEKGISMKYDQVHQVIGEGNFVLAMSEGSFGDQAQAFYDLFRLDQGLIVEHWDIITTMPGDDAPNNDAGKF